MLDMKKYILLCTALLGGCGLISAKSTADIQNDSLAASSRIITLDNGNVTTSRPSAEAIQRISTFLYDQYRNAQDPGAPYFLFMSKEENLMMGLGGVVRMRGWYDWGNIMPGNAFIPYQIPMQHDPANNKKLGITPAGTALFFRVIGNNRLLGQYQAYIEANFNGSGSEHNFHLKKAYVIVRDFTVGYASSTFPDPAACPSTVDSQGPNNKMDRTSVLVRYMPRITKNILAAVSIENPQNYISADGIKTQSRDSYIPDFAAMVQYDWGHLSSQHVRLSAIYRSLPYRNLVNGTNHNMAGWGVQLSSVNHPIDPLTLYLTFNYGAGYEGMGGDLLVGNCDLIGDPDRPGYMYAPRAFGWCAGVQYNFRPNLYMTLIASQSRMLPSKAIDADQYKYGLLGTVNIFWNPLPRVMLGAEFDIAKRQNFSRAHDYSRRVGIVGQLSF